MAKRKPKSTVSVKDGSIVAQQTSTPTLPNLTGRATNKSVGLAPEKGRGVSGGMLVSASSAGSKSGLFPKGGDAFAAYCRDQGISVTKKRPSEEWTELLQEFSEQPILGLRRGEGDSSHKPSPTKLG